LIDARTDKHLWAETYDRELEDIFEIQSDVAKKIAAALKAQFSPAEQERIDRKPTGDLQAYDYYLKGEEYLQRSTKEDNERALELYHKALELDPNYAFAYYNRGLIYDDQGDYEQAIADYTKAIELDPNDARHFLYYAENCIRMRNYDQAADLLSRANTIHNLNPEALFSNISLYTALLYAAKKEKQKALKIYPKPSSWLYALLEMNDESIAFISNKSQTRPASYYWDLLNNPFYEAFRDDPRFMEILKREQQKHQTLLDDYRGL